jgi:hypothetical protein
MYSNYSRSAGKSTPKGYNNFADEWNHEVAKRVVARLKGEDVIIISRRTADQLAEYHDKLMEHKRSLLLKQVKKASDAFMV